MDDLERIYDIVDELFTKYHQPMEDLAAAISQDFHATLTDAHIPLLRPSQQPGCYLHTKQNLMALSRLDDLVGGHFRVILGLNTLCNDAAPPPDPNDNGKDATGE